MDGGSFSEYPSTYPDLDKYEQSSYAASATTVTLDNSYAVSDGSYVMDKDAS